MNENQIPVSVAVCPYCGEHLSFEVDEWETDTGVPTEAGVHVSCVNQDDAEIDHYQMPYVYWLPVDRRVYQWLIATGYTVPPHTPEQERAMLFAWEKGLPVRYGPRSWDVWEYGRGWRPKR